MPKYNVTFTFTDTFEVEIEAENEQAAINKLPDSAHGFDDMKFKSIECLDIDDEGNERCDKTIELFKEVKP